LAYWALATAGPRELEGGGLHEPGLDAVTLGPHERESSQPRRPLQPVGAVGDVLAEVAERLGRGAWTGMAGHERQQRHVPASVSNARVGTTMNTCNFGDLRGSHVGGLSRIYASHRGSPAPSLSETRP